MVKVIASVLKKVPVPGVEYSNQQFSGGLEVELPEGVEDEAVRERLREMYALLSETVEAEIAAVTEASREAGHRACAPDRSTSHRDAPPSNNRRDGYDDRDRGRGTGCRDNDNRRDRGYQDNGRRDFRDQEHRDNRRDGGQRNGGSWRGNGNGGSRGGVATNAQVKAVFGIAKAHGIERRDLMEQLEDRFGVRHVEDLSVREASQFIEQLKAA